MLSVLEIPCREIHGTIVDSMEDVFCHCKDFIRNEKGFYPFIYFMPIFFPQQLDFLKLSLKVVVSFGAFNVLFIQ